MVNKNGWPRGNGWTLEYPEKYRPLLKLYGYQDACDPITEQFNRDLIEISDECEGKDPDFFKRRYEFLCWDYRARWARHPWTGGSGATTTTCGITITNECGHRLFCLAQFKRTPNPARVGLSA